MSAIPAVDGRRVYANYSPDVAKRWDVIVIGSGMGGMACAAALAKQGRRVLVLEQHYVPGGFTHMYARKGFQSLPESVDRLGTRLLGLVTRDPWRVTTEQVLDECGIEGKLRTILTLHWGYYGSIPRDSAFGIHALTHTHLRTVSRRRPRRSCHSRRRPRRWPRSAVRRARRSDRAAGRGRARRG